MVCHLEVRGSCPSLEGSDEVDLTAFFAMVLTDPLTMLKDASWIWHPVAPDEIISKNDKLNKHTKSNFIAKIGVLNITED